jgi:hypothetical protein
LALAFRLFSLEGLFAFEYWEEAFTLGFCFLPFGVYFGLL